MVNSKFDNLSESLKGIKNNFSLNEKKVFYNNLIETIESIGPDDVKKIKLNKELNKKPKLEKMSSDELFEYFKQELIGNLKICYLYDTDGFMGDYYSIEKVVENLEFLLKIKKDK